jgi:ABC-type thiamine transport system substrate-binding protein
VDQDEHFANALIAFQAYDKQSGVVVDREAYTTSAADGNAIDAGNRIVAASFERNHILSLSGVSVNGNRLLRLNLNKAAADHFVDLFMSYTKHASIHLDTNLIST